MKQPCGLSFPLRTLGVLCVAVVCFSAVPASATIRYEVSVAEPEKHIFRVKMTAPEVKDELIVQLPAWNALYQIRDFAYRVQNVRARDANDVPLTVTKLDKQTWQVRGRGAVTVEYAIFWDEPGPFSTQLNANHAFINLATVLMYVPGRRGEDARITFTGVREGWGIAVAVRPGENSATFLAANYDALVDAPVEIGEFQQFRFETQGAGRKIAIRVAVHGDGWDQAVLTESLKKIVTAETETMRDVPFEEFLFIYHFGTATGGGGGGMEHANSAAIHLGNAAQFEGVTAHEFFHLWNVKRIRPRSLEPVDYTKENWTRALWFAEGVTSTYASYTLVRSGLWSRGQFYDDLGGQIAELESRPSHLWKSAEEASLDAWLEKYNFYRRPEYSISYYNKGQILGVLLDILIRDATDNRAGLDDVLRDLNENFAKRGKFYDETTDLRAAAERAAGKDFREFFARYVAGTDELPCRETLARAGLRLKALGQVRADFGFAVGRGLELATTVTQVESGSGAEKAGLREGDILLEVNSAAFPRNASNWLRAHQPGEGIKIKVRRNGSERELTFALGQRQESSYRIEEDEAATEKQRRIREGLLKGTADR
ncbi:MAG: M61 family metallopeptidase [Acidobacteria bacterium]|nr:M61 family metallopeptidase [Acidobacteriota bacterium]MBI3663205.1 M61 family metallopeptidase [Acidobacteriota bacterium]